MEGAPVSLFFLSAYCPRDSLSFPFATSLLHLASLLFPSVPPPFSYPTSPTPPRPLLPAPQRPYDRKVTEKPYPPYRSVGPCDYPDQSQKRGKIFCASFQSPRGTQSLLRSLTDPLPDTESSQDPQSPQTTLLPVYISPGSRVLESARPIDSLSGGQMKVVPFPVSHRKELGWAFSSFH